MRRSGASPSGSAASFNAPLDANQPSSAKPAPSVDAWTLYRKVGRRWHFRDYQVDTFIEILEVHAEEAVVRIIVKKAEKVESDHKETVKLREGWAPNIPYVPSPEVRYLTGREAHRTVAGLFDCNVYQVPTHAGNRTYWTYVWASRDFNGLLVEAEVHAPAGLVEHVFLIEFFDPP